MHRYFFIVSIILIFITGCTLSSHTSREHAQYIFIQKNNEKVFLKSTDPQIKEIFEFIEEYLHSKYSINYNLDEVDTGKIYSYYSTELLNNPIFTNYYKSTFNLSKLIELKTKYMGYLNFDKIIIYEDSNCAEVEFVFKVEYLDYKKGTTFGFVGEGPEVSLKNDVLTQNVVMQLIKEENQWKISKSILLPHEFNP
ncbi:MAG: hypothetical protein QXX30_04330 [Candidatus Aenigmatarchaeota archaeon]